MRITETFLSIQGEGRKAGLPTAFVRTTGCHLRCSWCDAAYTFTGGEERDLDDLVAWVEAQPTMEVCFTGGEPLLQKQAWSFLDRLLATGRSVVVETAGNLDFSRANEREDGSPRPEAERARLTISMDLKCPRSGEHEKDRPELMRDLRPSDQVKFVVADRADYDFAKGVLQKHGFPPCPVYVNPVGGVDPKHVTEWLLEDPMPVHVGVQLHKLVWGDQPGR